MVDLLKGWFQSYMDLCMFVVSKLMTEFGWRQQLVSVFTFLAVPLPQDLNDEAGLIGILMGKGSLVPDFVAAKRIDARVLRGIAENVFAWGGQPNIVVSWYLHNEKSILFIQISHGQSRYHFGQYHVPKTHAYTRPTVRAINFFSKINFWCVSDHYKHFSKNCAKSQTRALAIFWVKTVIFFYWNWKFSKSRWLLNDFFELENTYTDANRTRALCILT